MGKARLMSKTTSNKTSSNKTSSTSGRALGLAGAILALCCGLDSHHQSLASDPFRFSDVAVYLDRDPPCTPVTVNSITVTVSPFKPQVNLGDLVTELARRAAEARANTVYAIKLISFVPNEGAIATATIATCSQPDPSPRDNLSIFDPQLVEIVKRAPEVRAYRFAGGAPDRQGSVQTSEPQARHFGRADSVARLRQLILSSATYRRPTSDETTKIDNPCPFVAGFGFEFRESNNSAWWLVSESCAKATLVPRDKRWLDADTLNLTTESVEAFRQLLDPSQ